MAQPTKSDVSTAPSVMVLPGIPGQMERLETGQGAYPSTTTDLVKLLCEAGLTVEYAEEREDRRQISYHAAVIIIPILLFAQGVVWAVAADLIADAIRGLFSRDRIKKGRLRVKVGRRGADGEAHWFEADGNAEDVLQAMRDAQLDD